MINLNDLINVGIIIGGRSVESEISLISGSQAYLNLDSTKYNKIMFYLDKKNNTDIIISASPEFLLKPVSKKLKFKLIATKVDKKRGLFLGKNCYGKEKVKRWKKGKTR